MYQLKTFEQVLGDEIPFGDEETKSTPPSVEEQFNEWAKEQHSLTKVVHFDRQVYNGEYHKRTTLTVLYQTPTFG